MGLAAEVVASIVALLHVGFFVLESVLWTKPTGRRIFRQSPADAETTRVLASNQGVYNLMLSVGIAWAIATGNASLAGFLLFYVAVVGVYGGITAKGTILLFQAAPALVGLALLALGF